jgi:outer membrane immunogenic protein
MTWGAVMKKLFLASVAVIALAIGPASAADLSAKRVYKAPPVVAPVPVLSWTGCYVGGFVGGAWGGRVNATEPVAVTGPGPLGTPYNFFSGFPYSYDLDGSFIGGGTIGCNYQWPGSIWVTGIEGEVGYINLKNTVVDPNSIQFNGSDTHDTTKIGNAYGVVAGRFGVALSPAWLLYAKGGVAFVNVSSSLIDSCVTFPCGPGTINASGSKEMTTWALGGGIEYALINGWSIKGEYLFLGLDQSFTICGAAGGVAHGIFCGPRTLDGVHTAKLGLNYRFNWGKAPVVARY